jgi:hypothetical protein
MNRHVKSVVVSMVKIGAAWWLLKKLPKVPYSTSFEARTPEEFGLRPQPKEQSIDDMIEASFPASDPSAWTPIRGTGSVSR